MSEEKNEQTAGKVQPGTPAIDPDMQDRLAEVARNAKPKVGRIAQRGRRPQQLPQGSLAKSERNTDIANMYYGRAPYNREHNLSEIGRKHKLSPTRIRKILGLSKQ
jgi:DNA-directed RNA polymerase sigma subunit (sigma70/sigma32)